MEKKSLILCDTNIIIEFYKENPSILTQLHKIGQENIAVSIITVGELLYGALNKEELVQIKRDLAHLQLLHIDRLIDDCFVKLMSEYSLSHGLSLPDGLIAATALVKDVPLYTLNKKDFKYIPEIHLYP